MKIAKDFVRVHRQLLIFTVVTVGVYLLWLFRYPHLMLAREHSQLFLCNKDYFCERLAEPGGLARYLGEGIVQFFIIPNYGALWYPLLFVLAVWQTWRLLPNGKLGKYRRNLLSLIPALLLLYFWTDPKIPMTLTIAVLMALGAMNLIRPLSQKWSLVATAVAIPVGYWLIGPAIVLVALYHLRWLCKDEKKSSRGACAVGTAALVILLVGCIFVSSWMVPHPVRNLFCGLDYHWNTIETKDKEETPDKIGTIEEMEYDRLLRKQDWAGITAKALKQEPKSLAVQIGVLYARFRLGEIGQQDMIDQMQRLHYNRKVLNSEEAAFILSDVYLPIGMVNMSQRAAFEAMESIPNYGKSGRALQRLVETNLITGNYEVALKYLSILDETLFYSKWVEKMRPLAENPQLIQKHPVYQPLQKIYSESIDGFFY